MLWANTDQSGKTEWKLRFTSARNPMNKCQVNWWCETILNVLLVEDINEILYAVDAAKWQSS